MSEHHATVHWRLRGDDFSYQGYNREHEWLFGDDVRVPASAAPDFLGRAGHVDPEAALVAALSSCHMLTFLALCARRGLTVENYRDEASGTLEKNDDGRLAVTRVTLRPDVAFRDPAPDGQTLENLHHKAHEHCFIANSVKTEITISPKQE